MYPNHMMHETASLLWGASQDITSNEVVELCLAILRLLLQSSSAATFPARSFADLLALLAASMAGEEGEEQRNPIPLYMLNLILLTFCTSEHPQICCDSDGWTRAIAADIADLRRHQGECTQFACSAAGPREHWGHRQDWSRA